MDNIFMNYDALTGSHDNLPDGEAKIDRAKQLVTEHLAILHEADKEAKEAGVNRLERYAMLNRALNEGIMDNGPEKVEAYLMAIVTLCIDL
jgi:hypothetical protein